MKPRFLYLVGILAFATTMVANAQNLKGRVTDSKGEGIPVATILLSGTATGTVTDIDGYYEFQVKPDDVLEFSFIGMKTQVVPVRGRKVINVTLEDDTTLLEEVVVVGYGSQKKADITNAVSSVKGSELLKAPAVGVSSMVGTRVAGVVALQQSGQPGADGASLLVRGQGAVCIVDGVQRNLNEIDPNEIESVSVLKDATSASIYGLNSSAVILVTTKKGDSQKPRISYNGEYGISENTNMLRLLNGPEYAYWYNRTRELDFEALGQKFTPVFTKKNVQDMITGSNGWGNTDWYSLVFGTGTTQHHNISVNGGNDRVRFFTSIGYFEQMGNVQNFTYSRYNIRQNIEAKISDELTFEMNIAGRVENRARPGFTANPDDWLNIPQQAVRALPYVPATCTIDGITYPVATKTDSAFVSPLSAISDTGSYTNSDSYLQTNFSLKYDVPFIKGLYAKVMASYDFSLNTAKALQLPCKVAAFDPGTLTAGEENTELKYTIMNDARGDDIGLSESSSWSSYLTTQSSINYEREFGLHKIKAIALLETRENKSHIITASGKGLEFVQLDELNQITNKTGAGSVSYPTVGGYSGHSKYAGYAGRLNYNFADRYLIEASMRYDGSYVFGGKKGSRWVALPGVSAGWMINKEPWFKASWIQLLKLRASVGRTANSNISASQYMDLIRPSKNAVVLGGVSTGMLYASTLGNPDLTWAKVKNYNVGFDFEAWNGLLGVEGDVFYKYEYDILSSVTGSYSPSRGGFYFTTGNENKRDYRGFELTLRHNNYIGSFNYGAKFVMTYAYRRWLYYAGDADNTPDYKKLTGKEVGSLMGFMSDGLFQSDEETKNSALIPGYRVAAGYIKYVDRNGDGKITEAQDMGYVASGAYPRLQGSLNLYANWKGFDIDMLWQGATGRTVSLTGFYTATGSEGIPDSTYLTRSFYHGGNSPLYLLANSWSPENPDAEFPRPSVMYLSNNNGWASDYWYRDGTYLRLKTLQIGYSVPQKILKPVGVTALRVYAQGSNLLTFSELTKYGIDPEQPAVNNGYYPQQKIYQFGVKLTF